MKKVVAGIDIGGTFTKLGIVDREGMMLADGTIQTDAFLDLNDYLDELSGAVKMLLAESGENIEMQGIGIGAPNANYYKGTIEGSWKYFEGRCARHLMLGW